MNTFDEGFMAQLGLQKDLANETEIDAYPLSEVFKEHLPPDQQIDFLTIDVEGMELKVLSSNDWSKYRPKLVMLESFATLSEDLLHSNVVKLLEHHDYRVIIKTTNELAFLDNKYRLSIVGQIELD